MSFTVMIVDDPAARRSFVRRSLEITDIAVEGYGEANHRAIIESRFEAEN